MRQGLQFTAQTLQRQLEAMERGQLRRKSAGSCHCLTRRGDTMAWQDVVFQYDGSFDGFLCCVFESYVHKEFPIAFYSDEECFPCIPSAAS